MLKIRMARAGAKKRPFYRIVVADGRSPRDGKFLEKVGTHNPLLAKDSPERVIMNLERIQYWLSKGAQPSGRINAFLVKAGILKETPRTEQTKQHQPKKKAQERLQAEIDKKAAAIQAEIDKKAAEEQAAQDAKREAEEAATQALTAAEETVEQDTTSLEGAPQSSEISSEETPSSEEQV